MGVTELGARRKLLAARATRAQYESMSGKIEMLELENSRLREAQAEAESRTALTLTLTL